MGAILQTISGNTGPYGLMAALALVLCYVGGIFLCVRLRHDTQGQVIAMLCAMVFLFLGAKLFGIISYASYFMRDGLVIDWAHVLEKSGIVFYGGLLGYLLGLRILLPHFLRKSGADLTTGYAIATTLLPFFHGVSRIGCYLGHCCYGVENAHFASFWEGRVPVQLFESAFCLLLSGLLLYLLFKRPKLRGWLLPLYLAAYSVFRFVIEFWRGDAVRGGFWVFSFSQWVSVGIWVALFGWLLWKHLKPMQR
ncbi:MAG: prolipoprotein diacylglyceryl transferase [Clostridiales bacterium]|nr:prolipoprotein diacylglyceryl transferase [Clostridiales bacterium]